MGTFIALQMRSFGKFMGNPACLQGYYGIWTYEGSPHANKGFRRKALLILMPGPELAMLIYVILET